MATLVKFLKKDNDIYAYFPQLNYAKYLYGNSVKTCYAHIGQHSACAVEYAKESKPAKCKEYEGLLKELISVGYTDLKVLNK